jgi:preprotein translocase subunit YajC
VDKLVSILPLVGIALLFWLLFVRPARRRQQVLGSMQSTLSVGDEVMLTSGIFGTVRALDDDALSLEVADGVTVRVVRAAIGKVVTPVTQSRDDETELAGQVADEPEEK